MTEGEVKVDGELAKIAAAVAAERGEDLEAKLIEFLRSYIAGESHDD